MATAKIKLPTGGMVTIEGNANEIIQIIQLYKNKNTNVTPTKSESKHESPNKFKKVQKFSGPQGYIAEMVQDGFFKKRKTISDVQNALETDGHIYPQTALSPALLRLVQKKIIRRLSENGKWVYVNR